MNLRGFGAVLGGMLLGTALVMSGGASAATSEEDAHAIGVEAYLYLYPLVRMEITREQFTNVEPGKEFGKGPMNAFVNIPIYPPADFRGVVTPNFDTL
jgi:hypothetical protein